MLRISEIKSYVADHMTPRSTVIKGAAYGTAWYTGALVHTYSQPVLVGIFRQAMASALGANIGTGVSLGIVSPALVPVIVPAVAIAGATAAYYGTSAIGNIAHEALFGCPKAAAGKDGSKEPPKAGGDKPCKTNATQDKKGPVSPLKGLIETIAIPGSDVAPGVSF